MTKKLPYDPSSLPRELTRHYISASDEDIQDMLKTLGIKSLKDLFSHIPQDVLFKDPLNLPDELSYEALQDKLQSIASKNTPRTSFIADALPVAKQHPIVPHICSIRGLTTTYTPYQPERSQGTLISLWIYQCLLAKLTGFEAINASLYDRSTALFEALVCSLRIQRKATTVLVSDGIFPQDKEVLQTLAQNSHIQLQFIPLSQQGTLDTQALQDAIHNLGPKLAAFAFPQVNQLGLLEDIDLHTNLCHQNNLLAISIIDPLQIANSALKPPSEFGDQGADILVAEGQHLAIAPNFGGPGLGIFGVRHNERTKNHVRATPGRFIGKAKDLHDNDAFVMVLSTREQHIRKDAATSNICSNQAFLATLAGASLLAQGHQGLQESAQASHELALEFLSTALTLEGIQLAFPNQPFFNEVLLELPSPIPPLLQVARNANIHLGTDMSHRLPRSGYFLKISFSNNNTPQDLQNLLNFLSLKFPQANQTHSIPPIPQNALRSSNFTFPEYTQEEIKDYYSQLGSLNATPDNAPFPLGSCTMKYNPYINDWAASLPNFTQIHPQANLDDAQGCLEVLYEIQEWFKTITGLHAVTTQPVAGAQGELVSIKMFQAYHNHHNQPHRTKILIPKSAHGTNFATAIMAGYSKDDIVYLNADPSGHIDMADFNQKLSLHANNISGIMVTNPNTSGLFEHNFKNIAQKIHQAGGLVFMDGANMNAIAGWVNLDKLGVDAIHNNLHKTWTIPHGGGGPGDAIVAVSKKLSDFLPGFQVKKENDQFTTHAPKHSIGSLHRHFGNFAHKIRCLTYLYRLGKQGIPKMSATAVLSARYMFHKLKNHFPSLPKDPHSPRMHEFILTLSNQEFSQIEALNIPKAAAIPRIGKLFLDLGYHAPTVAFPEPLGLMFEPTESYSKPELDQLINATLSIKDIIKSNPNHLINAPTNTPTTRIDEVQANRNLTLFEDLAQLPKIPQQPQPTHVY